MQLVFKKTIRISETVCVKVFSKTEQSVICMVNKV